VTTPYDEGARCSVCGERMDYHAEIHCQHCSEVHCPDCDCECIGRTKEHLAQAESDRDGTMQHLMFADRERYRLKQRIKELEEENGRLREGRGK